jgi:hypothetical protein
MVRAVREGESIEVGHILVGFNQFVPALIVSIFVFGLVCLGLLLLIIPGLVLLAGWIFTFQAMALEKLGPVESMSRSWELFREHLSIVLVVCVLLIVINSMGSAVVLGGVLTGPFSLICLTVVYSRLAAPRALPEAEMKPFGVE